MGDFDFGMAYSPEHQSHQEADAQRHSRGSTPTQDLPSQQLPGPEVLGGYLKAFDAAPKSGVVLKGEPGNAPLR